MLRAALALVQRGCAVFPCRQRSKLPATAHGCLDASTDAAVVTAWWCAEPNYNVAVATGKPSGLFVVDVDSLDAEAVLRELEAAHGALPPTVEAITARGRHVYFRMPPAIDLRSSAGRLGGGLDVRANGGFVLTPPSIHPSGRRYCWSVDCAGAIADAPDWLVAKLAPGGSNGTRGNGNSPVPPAEWRELAANGVGEGARDCTAAKLAGHLLRHRIDPFVTLELLQAWNAQRCTPPLPTADIERIVGSIARRELGRRRAHDG